MPKRERGEGLFEKSFCVSLCKIKFGVKGYRHHSALLHKECYVCYTIERFTYAKEITFICDFL